MNSIKTLSHVGLGIALVAGISLSVMAQSSNMVRAFYSANDTKTPVTPVTPPVTFSTSQIAPVIVTDYLPSGFINQQYSADITAIDRNIGDELTMSITGLPGQIQMQMCSTYVQNNYRYLTCGIAGKAPATASAYPIVVTVRDNRGGVKVKHLSINIQNQLKK